MADAHRGHFVLDPEESALLRKLQGSCPQIQTSNHFTVQILASYNNLRIGQGSEFAKF